MRALLILVSVIFLSGCYTLKSAYNQISILTSKESYEETLKRPELTEEQKKKLLLAQEARDYAESILKLNSDGNFSKVVWLDRPYVTWAVNASDPWMLKPYEWNFPIVGRVPYLGFFKKKDAEEKRDELKKQGLDTYMRGVSAYSTLGWFEDPLLSSMLNYDDHELVETIIHELVHSTVWVKDNADFNERLASFLGQKGAELFYIKKEGPQSPTTQKIKDYDHDGKLFSAFITTELKSLDEWYKNLIPANKTEESKAKRIKQIQEKYVKELKPKLKIKTKGRFETATLNNAQLVLYRTYLHDFSPFENLWSRVGGSFQTFVQESKKLIKSENPDADIEKLYLNSTQPESK